MKPTPKRFQKPFRVTPDMWLKIATKLLANKHAGREPSTWQSLIEMLLNQWLAEEGGEKWHSHTIT